MTRAIFLDRDGTINHMVKYFSGWDAPQKARDVKLIDGVAKIISWANKNKILVIEVSNQPGVAKGKMSQKESDAIEDKIHFLLNKKKVVVNKAYICPHHPNAVITKLRKNCNCRKPKPGLLIKAAKDLDIDLSKSIFLGDKVSDIRAGRAAGVKTVIYLHNEDEPKKVTEAQNPGADYKVKSMKAAFRIITNYFKLR